MFPYEPRLPSQESWSLRAAHEEQMHITQFQDVLTLPVGCSDPGLWPRGNIKSVAKRI